MGTTNKVLISGVGGSLFPYLFNSLRKKRYLVFGVDSNDMIKRIYPNQNVFVVPLVHEEDYGREIEKIIKRYNIEYYIPLIDEEIINAHHIAAKSKDLKLISPERHFAELCLDKFWLATELKKQDISNLKTFLAEDYDSQLGFPVFLKPRISRGSRGIRRISDKSQLEAYFCLEEWGKQDVIVQEYLEGMEYSVSVVVNNLNNLIAIVPKRIITKRGITLCAVTEKNSQIEHLCKSIVEKLKPCNPFNVQLKITAKGVQVFEINPRFSTTSILSIEAGVDEFDLAMKNFNKERVAYSSSFEEGLYLYRRWDTIFV